MIGEPPLNDSMSPLNAHNKPANNYKIYSRRTMKVTITIAEFNDKLRQCPHLWVFTLGVLSLPLDKIEAIIQIVRDFDNFNEDNDPWGEHDFGSFDFEGTKYFWKIESGHLCVMEASEY